MFWRDSDGIWATPGNSCGYLSIWHQKEFGASEPATYFNSLCLSLSLSFPNSSAEASAKKVSIIIGRSNVWYSLLAAHCLMRNLALIGQYETI